MTQPAICFDTFNPDIRPQDDLFGFVNGTWASSTPIPDDKSSWGAFHELREASEKAIHEIIVDVDEQNSPDAARIAHLFASFMDTARIEQLGCEPIRPLLDRVDQIGTVGDLAEFWGWSLRHGIGCVIDMDNDADPGDPTRYRMFVGQAGIGLPDEEYYRLDEHAEIREAYLAHIERVFALVGLKNPAEQAQAVFDLETRIAACHWDKVRTRDMQQMYHPQTWADFVADSPALCWDRFLAGAKLPESALEVVINCQHTFCPKVAQLVDDEALEAWRSWARWQVINSTIALLSDEFVEANFDFYGRTLQGVPQIRERWKRGVSLVESTLGESVGKIYVDRHFPAPVKAQADELVANLLEAYRRSISTLEWMSETTRAEALKKLSKFKPKIGYPNTWRDYSALEIRNDDLVGNVLRASSVDFDYTITQLSGPIDPEEWLMFPQTVNAYYHPLRNEIVFPAAILQPPFFNPAADDAVNYGAIGAVIGHEIGHGFDDQGSTCDGDGRLRNWWDDVDREAFEQRTQALVAQYDQLSPTAAPDVTVNGQLTLGENIGDLGGLAIAYLAWRIAQEKAENFVEGAVEGSCESSFAGAGSGSAVGSGEVRDAGRVLELTPEQRFFVGWAQTWRTITREKAAKERIATDPHSPDEIRCNQVVRNLQAFHDAFDITPGDAMYLAPEDRVSIWN